MHLPHYFHTVRHLQWKQVYYRLFYKIKKPFFRPGTMPGAAMQSALDFPAHEWHTCLPGKVYAPVANTFSFLNLEHSFETSINWDWNGYGRLWTYNLNYFSWLEDESVPAAERLQTILAYVHIPQHPTGDEPYPSSLRGIHWIQFISRHGIKEEAVISQLYNDYQRLAAFPEYHLGGNHLMENAFSLLWGAFFFKNENWLRQAGSLLQQTLSEQVLSDGGHYERSPMYHCLLLYRLLQCLELMQLAPIFTRPALQTLLADKAAQMLGWLEAFCFADGSYAMFGDAAPGIAPTPASLRHFATDLGITPLPVQLKASGYRKLQSGNYELLINAGTITPAYQPGHSHADSLSFCLQVNGRPFITDTGISTYDANGLRLAERSTAAHNTITINNSNSSDVWKSFRIAARATVTIEEENTYLLLASHTGYLEKYGIICQRSFACNEKITITDVIKNQKANKALLHLHFHPAVSIRQEDTCTFVATGGVTLVLKGITEARLEQYNFCDGFNKLKMAQKLVCIICERADIVLEF